MPNIFDEASRATEDLFGEQANPEVAEEPIPEETPEDTSGSAEIPTEVPAEETPAAETPENATPAETALGEAAQTAEIAAQVATQKDGELQNAMAEIEALKQQNQQMQATIDEISQQNAQHVVEEAMELPTLDINGLAFADEETQQAAVAKFAENLLDYNRNQMMQELSPVLDYAKKGMREAETRDAIASLSQIPELANIQEMLPQLDRIIANNKWLSSDDMPIDEKYINAYAIAKGVNLINNPPAPPQPPKEPTPEELLEIYNNNPAFQELVEKQRLDTIKKSQQVPPFSASSGAVNAALDIKDEPKSWDEASKRTRQMPGMN